MRNIRLIQPSTGKDYTDEMKAYADKVLSEIKEIDGFIMKSKSPSSGIRDVKIYPVNPKSAALTKKSSGIFGAEILKRFPDKVIEDEGRLNDPFLREIF